MTYEEAKVALTGEIAEDGGLDDNDWDYMHWDGHSITVCLDGSFTPLQLETIAAYMRGRAVERD